jgi:hypothetical protein
LCEAPAYREEKADGDDGDALPVDVKMLSLLDTLRLILEFDGLKWSKPKTEGQTFLVLSLDEKRLAAILCISVENCVSVPTFSKDNRRSIAARHYTVFLTDSTPSPNETIRAFVSTATSDTMIGLFGSKLEFARRLSELSNTLRARILAEADHETRRELRRADLDTSQVMNDLLQRHIQRRHIQRRLMTSQEIALPHPRHNVIVVPPGFRAWG